MVQEWVSFFARELSNLLNSPDWGTIPQWLTVAVAIGALATAIRSIDSQKEIARKRAAMDFFAKTEMDRETLESHRRFTEATDRLNAMLVAGKTCADFIESEDQHYRNLRDYLNLHELMSVGLLTGVFDDTVCSEFWAGELGRAYDRTRPLIDHIQSLDGERYTYSELRKVAMRWSQRAR